MKNLRLLSDLKTLINISYTLTGCVLLLFLLLSPNIASARIYIDITSPSISRINIAIPDFKNFSKSGEHPELAADLAGVVSNNLDLSGYFLPMEKRAFLDEDGPGITAENIRFRNWSLIGAELLLKAAYTSIGRNIEVNVRLYDADWGTLVFGKVFLGRIDEYRPLMHRISNEIIFTLTGNQGPFLSRFAFVNNSTGSNEIYISDFDGYNAERITDDNSIAMFPRWSHKGDSIAYNSFKEEMGPMLYLKDLSSGKTRKISGRTGLNTGARWLRDGKSIDLTLSFTGTPNIYTIDLNGKILKQLTRHWAIDISPSRSPDENKMVFVSSRSGSPQIYIMDVKTESVERLTFDLSYCVSPVWSSTNIIAFAAIEENNLNIYTMNPDGSNLRKLTQNSGNNEEPYWSPDGRYIAFSSNRTGGSHQVYIMNSNGQNQRRITFLKGESKSPAWSPY